MLARLATRRAKPAGSFHLRPATFTDLLPTLDIQDLHGFGRAAREKAVERLGTSNLGELAGRSKAALCDALGKSMGETLHNAMRGVDERKLESDKPRKSVSCDINVRIGVPSHLDQQELTHTQYGIRFENDDQVEAFIYQMSEEVARRLDAICMKSRSLTLKIMKRDPSAPVEAPKVCGRLHTTVRLRRSRFCDFGHSSWDMVSVLRITNSQPSQTPTDAQQPTHA